MLGFLTSKLTLTLAIIAVIVIALAVVARNWSCRAKREPRPDPVASYDVAGVPTGNRIEVETGRRGRKTRSIVLHGIGVPTEDQALAEQSRANLERLAGSIVRATIVEGRRLGREEIEAEVFGEAGANCQIEQLRAGLAWVTDTTRKDYLAAEQEAKKAKRGLWAKKVRPGEGVVSSQ